MRTESCVHCANLVYIAATISVI